MRGVPLYGVDVAERHRAGERAARIDDRVSQLGLRVLQDRQSPLGDVDGSECPRGVADRAETPRRDRALEPRLRTQPGRDRRSVVRAERREITAGLLEEHVGARLREPFRYGSHPLAPVRGADPHQESEVVAERVVMVQLHVYAGNAQVSLRAHSTCPRRHP